MEQNKTKERKPSSEFRNTLFANDQWLPDELLHTAEVLSDLSEPVRANLKHNCEEWLIKNTVAPPPVNQAERDKQNTVFVSTTQLYFVYQVLERRDRHQEVVAKRGY